MLPATPAPNGWRMSVFVMATFPLPYKRQKPRFTIQCYIYNGRRVINVTNINYIQTITKVVKRILKLKILQLCSICSPVYPLVEISPQKNFQLTIPTKLNLSSTKQQILGNLYQESLSHNQMTVVLSSILTFRSLMKIPRIFASDQ